MSIIPCTETCVYEHDGNCNLERVASCGTTTSTSNGTQCVNYIEKPKAQ